jgi:ribonuclease J
MKVPKKSGRIPVGGVMYDDSGAVVSEVVLKDRIHMSQEGMFVVVLTIQRGSGRLLTSPDIISRGFIYLRDSEELMGMIRQYLKQKVARGMSGKRNDMEALKKEIKDEITHILYDQTRRTPIVIPVINEIGGGNGNNNGNQRGRQRQDGNRTQPNNGNNNNIMPAPSGKKFPPKQVPDTEAVVPHDKSEARGY